MKNNNNIKTSYLYRSVAISVIASIFIFQSCGQPTTKISSPGGGLDKDLNPPSATYNPVFACKEDQPLLPSSIRRVSKVHFEKSLEDFMSYISEDNISIIMASIKPKLEVMPHDMSEYEFSNIDSKVSQAHVQALMDVTLSLAEKLKDVDSASISLAKVCSATSVKTSLSNEACLEKFIRYYGRKSFRRPITNDELLSLKAFYNSFTGDDAYFALVAKLLANPHFFYNFENSGTAIEGDQTYSLSKYELLSKITFTFWFRPPNDELYDLVEGLDLSSDKAMDIVLDKVLNHPHAKTGILQFYSEWLQLDKKTANLNSTSKAFLTLADGLDLSTQKQQMIEEILSMVEYHTFLQKGNYKDLITSPFSFAKGKGLADVYGVKPWSGNPLELEKFPDEQKRAGFFGRAALVANDSEYTRPIMKGLNIRTQILCDDIPPAPPNANIQPLVQDHLLLTSEVVAHATRSDTCMACHAAINPLGFVTENYDSLGRFREKELKFDDNGDIANSIPVVTEVPANIFPGDTKQIGNTVQLAQHIVDTGKGQRCFARKFFRFSHARAENIEADGCHLENMRSVLAKSDGSLMEMFKVAAKQKSFRQRRIQ